MTEAEEKGMEFFETEPELLVAAVWHVAAKQYPELDIQREFVNGYITARRRRDEYQQEKRE